MTDIQQPCIIIPGHWIGHFIGRGGCFAANIRRTYHVSYNIETTHNDQGDRIGKIYVNGHNFTAAKEALCAEASRLNEIDERERTNSRYGQRPPSQASSVETLQRVPLVSSFPPLPNGKAPELSTVAAEEKPSKTRANPHEDVSHKIQSPDQPQATGVALKQLREANIVLHDANIVLDLRKALAEEQHKVSHLVAKNTILCALLNREREMASTTLVIRGIPKVRMNGEPFGGADALRETLAKAGEITSLHLSYAVESKDKQVGYVTFAERRTAEKLQKMLHGNKIEGSLMHVSFFVTRWD